MSSGKDGREYDGFASFPAGGLGDRTRVHDEFFLNGIRYYTQEQLDATVAAAREEADGKRLVAIIFHSPDTGPKAFALVREHDVSGVSGTGTVAYGVEFPDGTVALRWVGGNPTSVVFHDNGMESVEAIHGHGGNTRIMWLSEDLGPRAAEMDECEARGFTAGVKAAREAVADSIPSWEEPIHGWIVVSRNDALAAIDALARGKEGNRG